MPALTPLEFADKYRKLKTFLYPQELPAGVAPSYVPPKAGPPRQSNTIGWVNPIGGTCSGRKTSLPAWVNRLA
jgi:hypothetical protein